MQLRGPLVGPDRWWYHTLLKETVRDTLASYGSVPESGPSLFFDQRSSNQPETHSVVPGCVVPFYLRSREAQSQFKIDGLVIVTRTFCCFNESLEKNRKAKNTRRNGPNDLNKIIGTRTIFVEYKCPKARTEPRSMKWKLKPRPRQDK